MATDTLALGSFNLTDPSGTSWKAGVEAEGTSRGAPVPIEVAVQTWLQDGSIVVTQGYDNRELSIRVRMWATSLTALSAAEAALFAQLGKPNTLTWTPTSGPAAVFEVVTSSMVQDDTSGSADLLASQRLIRTYNLRLVCEAFTSSAATVTSTALPASGTTTTTLDAMSATTGWTATINGGAATVSNASGANSITQASPTAGTYVFTMQKTFAATTTSLKLLPVDWKPSLGGGTLSATGDGTALPLIAEGPSPTSGYVRSWFYVAASSLAVTRFTWTMAFGLEIPSVPALTLSLDNAAITDAQPSYGTGRQTAKTLSLLGSAPTKGSIAVEASTSLGHALIYTYPADATTNGYYPSMRQFRTAGNTVNSDSTRVSGSRESISGSGVTFQVPLSLLPRGVYILVVFMASTGLEVGTVTYTVSTVLGSNTLGATTTTTPSISVTGTYTPYALGRLSLPTVDADPFTPSKLQLNIAGSYSGVEFDEAWLYNTTIGRLVWVDCGSGTAAIGGPAKRLFLESPSVVTPRPTLRIGHSADRSDSFYPVGSVKAWQTPALNPSKLNIHTVTTNATDAVVTARYKPAWHTNPAS